jgi:endonuclease/exonuclease/phosphatase family metal-dependent hydrolase
MLKNLMSSHNCASFRVASYNVDGLSDNVMHATERCKEISRLVCNELPDLIFFQEGTVETTRIYSTLLGKNGYNLVSPQQLVESPYFTLAFSKVSGTCQRLHFKGPAHSEMGRDILSYEVVINNRATRFLSSHLESLADYKDTRTAQLEMMLDLITDFDGPSIVAGDLNIRNKEAEQVLNKMKKKSKEKNVPFQLFDCWESLGRNEKMKNTWIHGDPSLSHIQARYDRIYCNGHFIRATDFKLIGTDHMPAPVYTTPSDHFGMIAQFVIEEGASESGSASDSLQIRTSNESESSSSSNDKVATSFVSSTGDNVQEKPDAAGIQPVDQTPRKTDSKTDISSLEAAEESKKRKLSFPTERDGDDGSGDSERNSRRRIMAQAASRRLLSLNNPDSIVSAFTDATSALGASGGSDDAKAVLPVEDPENISRIGDAHVANEGRESGSPKHIKKTSKVVIDISDSPPSSPRSPTKPRSPRKPKSSNISSDVEIISLIDD